jgi:DegV family protein with EDD domain
MADAQIPSAVPASSTASSNGAVGTATGRFRKQRVGIVVDSACDIPAEILETSGAIISVVPINIRIGKEVVADTRDTHILNQFYHYHLNPASPSDAESVPISEVQFEAWFEANLVDHFDLVFVLTINNARSPIYDNAVAAAARVEARVSATRAQQSGLFPFRLRVYNSQNMFAGQAVQALDLLAHLEKAHGSVNLLVRVQELTRNTYTFLVPKDLTYLYKRARLKNENTIGLASYLVGSMLEIRPVLRCYRNESDQAVKVRTYDAALTQMFANAENQVRVGLLSPFICVSYSGDLADVPKLPGFASLKEAATAAGVTVAIAAMGMTGAVNVGAGGVCIGFVANPHEFGK